MQKIFELIDGNFTCPETDGKYNREDFALFFTGEISINIEIYKADRDSEPTPQIECHKQKLTKDATFFEMYSELATTLDDESKVWWYSTLQIKAVMEANPDKFVKDGRLYFFFYKNQYGNRLVFVARFYDNKWPLNLDELETITVWTAEYNYEVVLPQQVTVLK